MRGRAIAVASASLYSRAASVLLMVAAARVLSVSDFGLFTVLLGLSIAVANTFAVGAADLVASSAFRAATATRRSILNVLGFGTLSAAAVGAIGLFGIGTLWGSLIQTLSVCVSAALSMLVMSYFRGRGMPGVAATFGYVLPPTLRLSVVLVAGVVGVVLDLYSIFVLIAVAGIVVGGVASLAVHFERHNSEATDATPVVARKRGSLKHLAWVGLGISSMWLVLGQADLLALTLFQSPGDAGSYAPTMRIMEALTAVGIGFKFTATSELMDTSNRTLGWRRISILASAYILCGVAVFLLGPIVVPVLFGEGFEFLLLPALLLFAANWFTILIALHAQMLIAHSAYRSIVVPALGTSLLAVVVITLGAILAGATGAAAGDLVALSVGSIVMMHCLKGARPRINA